MGITNEVRKVAVAGQGGERRGQWRSDPARWRDSSLRAATHVPEEGSLDRSLLTYSESHPMATAGVALLIGGAALGIAVGVLMGIGIAAEAVAR